MKMILALTNNHTLGINNDLVVQSKEDMRYFKEYTTGHNIVMGRKTWESLDTKPLPNRINYVVTNQKYCSEYENVIFIKSLSEAPDDSIVIGGKQLYVAALNDGRLKEISLTRFNVVLDGDVYFTELSYHLLELKTWMQTGYENLGGLIDTKVFIFNKVEND